MRIGNAARMAAWAAVIGAVAAAAPLRAPLPCSPLACRVAGAALLGLVARAASVTGRYLAVYGEPERRGRGPGVPTRLVREGPYACMRHPMHLFLSLFPVSVALLVASPGSLLVSLAAMAGVLAAAVLVDEREAAERFGEEYERYRREVPPFSLDPRCLARALARRPPRPGRG